jgi:hypothetical protein
VTAVRERVLGVRLAAFAPQLRDATADLGDIEVAATERGSHAVSPADVLMALARIRGGVLESMLVRDRLDAATVCLVLRDRFGDKEADCIAELTAAGVTPATAEIFAALAARSGDDGAIGERELLLETLRRIEPPVATWLRTYGGVDLDAWIDDLAGGDAAPPEVFASDAADASLDSAVLSPQLARVLTIACREAAALRHDRVSVAVVFYAMAVAPGGLMEQGLHFLERDVPRERERLFATIRQPGRGAVGSELTLRRSHMESSLALTLERAAAKAADERASMIDERALLLAMLDTPGGFVSAYLREADVKVERLLRFAKDFYRQPEPEEEAAALEPILATEELRAELERAIVGQPGVVERLLPQLETVVRGRRRGWDFGDQPAARFFFCGPSGTGKTMTASIIARLVYGSDQAILKFEMGHFKHPESISNFIGAPPGYKGFGEGKLTNGLRDDPRRVLLLDEVDKADPTVLDALLTLLDEGRINDPAGPVRDARESVIVLTSNHGAEELAQLDPTSDPNRDPALRKRIREILEAPRGTGERATPGLRPEFLNRCGDVVLFTAFDRDELLRIAVVELERLAGRTRGALTVDLIVEDGVAEAVVASALALRAAESARGIKHTVAGLAPAVLRAFDDADHAGLPVNAIALRVAAGGEPVAEAVSRRDR